VDNYEKGGASLRLHAMLPSSQANGPGLRWVLWLQGCNLACPGCFNPETHPFNAGQRVEISSLAKSILERQYQIEGLSVSGGEPFYQAHALAIFLEMIRQQSQLSVLIFTGFSLSELSSIPAAPRVLEMTDVLIAGRYIQSRRVASGLIGSDNKKIHLLTNRYSQEDILSSFEAEVHIQTDGGILLTGIDPLQW